jgi:hypothetical protein
MKARDCKVSHLEWTISGAWRKREGGGGSPTTDDGDDLGKMQPTSIGIRSECLDQSTTKKLDISDLLSELGDTSKTRHEVLMMAWMVLIDQA